MGLFDFLKDCTDKTLYSACNNFEQLFILYDKMSFAAESRKILEQFTIVMGWEGNTLSERIKNASINRKIKEKLQEIVHFGNYAHHFFNPNSEVPSWNWDQKSYEKYTKEHIMSKLVSVMEEIYTGSSRKIKPDTFMTQSFQFRDSDFKFVEHLEPKSYSHFLFQKDNNEKSRVILRFITGPYLDSEKRARDKLRGTPVENYALMSDNVVYKREERQILALELSENQQQLRTLIHLNKIKKLNVKITIEIIYQLIENIIKPMLNLSNGTSMICHRNINPNTVIIQTNQQDSLSDGFKVRLCCFEHSKVTDSNLTVHHKNVIRKYYDENNPYILWVNPEENGSISIDNSKVMDAYSIARLLLYMTVGNPKDTIGFNKISEFECSFKQNVVSYLTTWEDGSKSLMTNRKVKDEFYKVDDFYQLITNEYSRLKSCSETISQQKFIEPSGSIQKLENNNTKLNQQIEELSGFIQELENDKTEIKQQNEELQNNIASLQEKYNNITSQNSDKISSMRTQIKVLKVLMVTFITLTLLVVLFFLLK